MEQKVGQKLRQSYDSGMIRSEADFNICLQQILNGRA